MEDKITCTIEAVLCTTASGYKRRENFLRAVVSFFCLISPYQAHPLMQIECVPSTWPNPANELQLTQQETGLQLG